MILLKEKNDGDGVMTINVEGSVDTTTAPELESCLEKLYSEARKIILDFSSVSYISSAGLRVLLRADSAMGGEGKFALKNVNSDVKEVLSLTGFCEIITILEG